MGYQGAAAYLTRKSLLDALSSLSFVHGVSVKVLCVKAVPPGSSRKQTVAVTVANASSATRPILGNFSRQLTASFLGC